MTEAVSLITGIGIGIFLSVVFVIWVLREPVGPKF